MLSLYLYAFILGNLSPNYIHPANALGCAEDATQATLTVGPLPGLTTTETARLLATWAGYESTCVNDIVSKDGKDCAVMQLRGIAQQGVPCSIMRKDRELAFTLGLRWMHVAVAMCNGSVAGGLRAYATGSCTKGYMLVSKRCKRAEVTCL